MVGLILLEPDFGTAVTLLAVVAVMVFTAGLGYRYLVGAALMMVPILAIVLIQAPYRVRRLLSFLNPWADPLGEGFQIIQSLLAVGSHDLLLDLLDDFLRRRRPGAGLSSAHVGSLAGLTALRRGECHLAGTHLIDEETGEYNVTWLRRFFAEGGAALVHLARREQGLIVPAGNPKGLTGLADLARPDVLFINRQRGSGTRQLLDYLMRRDGLDSEAVPGYHREVYTHLAVAAAVKSGGADAGLGILAAARALGLDFLPVASEQYDLAIRPDALALPRMQALLAVLTDPEFRNEVAALGGYDVSAAGHRLL